MQLDTQILEFLLENTEVSPEVVDLFAFCKTQEESLNILNRRPGQIASYIHYPEGIVYAWHTGDKMLFYFFEKECGEYYRSFIIKRILHGQESSEYIKINMKKWLQEAKNWVI
jgi:hypothetical protein